MTSGALWLGARRDDGEAVTLPRDTLLRHMMALGSSGSGKTVLSKVVVEECVRQGVPAICVDPQGDICSLLERADPAELIEAGVDPELADAFAEQVDVVIWTPGADVGVPLCADPVDGRLDTLEGDARARALSRTAATLTSLLGFELGGDDGDGLCAALDRALGERLARGDETASLRNVADELERLAESDFQSLQKFVNPRLLERAMQRLARLDVGARRRLFHDGYTIDIDRLLGLDAPASGKTRVSVVYLNALEQQEDKELVVAALADQLYRWMLGHPATTLQALFYIDEVAPFIPPVRKPSCKQGLSLLFKQARKYGVGCLMATQNPGDVDYKAMAQFGTWAIGRLTTRQDRKKVEPTVASLAGAASETVMDELARLRAGQFVLLSPDHLPAPAPLACRWLLSGHVTYDERRIEDAADRLWRERFPSPQATPQNETATAAPSTAPPPAAPTPPAIDAPPTPTPTVAQAPVGASAMNVDDELAWAELLLQHGPMDAKAFAGAMGVSPATARRRAKRLVAQRLAATYAQGRTARYWSPKSGLRPDIGLDRHVSVAAVPIQQAQAQALAERHRRTRVLGVIGPEERLAQLVMRHLPLVHVPFEEQVERSLLERALGPTHDRIQGSVYLHAVDLRYLVLDPRLSFAPRPADHASRIRDLDGAVSWHPSAPADLHLDDDWSRRRRLDEAVARVREDYPSATPGPPSYVFLPYWHVLLEQDGGSNYRVIDLDAIGGEPFEPRGT